MQEILTQLFGAYVPLVDGSGAALSGLAGVNWQWIAGVILFAIVLRGFFAVLNSIIRG